MAQIFPKWFNVVHFAAGAGAAFTGLLVLGFFWYFGSPEYTDVGYQPVQPVEFSHQLHAGEMGMDCRYCHYGVEKSHEANVPPTQVCMNCHNVVLPESDKLALVRSSFQTGEPIEWIRIHKTPDYAYFDHSAHVAAGVGCVECHGRIDHMEVVRQAEPLSMSWCLDCHRSPEASIRDLTTTKITDMDWVADEDTLKIAEQIIDHKQIQPPEDCSACHR